MVIRVGIIGLSASDGTWAASAHANPLQSAPLSSRYDLTAIATSSPDSAAKSAQRWGIKSSKAYVGADEISKDRDVDLVVVSVKLPSHRDLALPPLRAGKDVFVEWPLATTTEQVAELVQAAKEGGGKTYVGLQSRASPWLQKAKELIDSGVLGAICGSTVVALDSTLLALPPGADYMHDAKNRANITTINVGHILDAQAFVLGEYAHLTCQQNTFFPTIHPPHHPEPINRTSSDSYLVQGTLVNGAVASASFVQTLPGIASTFSWTITGSKGALRFEGEGINVQIAAPKLFLSVPDVEAEKRKIEAGEVNAAVMPSGTWQEVQVPRLKAGTQTGNLYAAITDERDGKVVKDSLVDFEGARLRHAMLEACERSAKNGTRESYL